jgi:peptidoglycan/xylan/chitin deacetylase (PgdA/CDA1 family)
LAPKIALTFDDGPYTAQNAHQTLDLLDIIKDCNSSLKSIPFINAPQIKVTFFLQGQHVNSGTKSAVSRMREEKHEVGNHSWSHEPGVIKLVPDDKKGMHGLTDEEALSSVTKTHDLISPLYPNLSLFRPPFGRIKHSQWQKIKAKFPHYRLIGWDRSPESDKLGFKNMREGASIVLLHDKMINKQGEVTVKNVKQFLDLTLVDIRKRDLELVTVSEIMRAGDFMKGIYIR